MPKSASKSSVTQIILTAQLELRHYYTPRICTLMVSLHGYTSLRNSGPRFVGLGGGTAFSNWIGVLPSISHRNAIFTIILPFHLAIPERF
jgi:hypothetical protein